ncbi:MAG: ABC-F family ATP-binding cassette domain-containing protein [Saprospiraceae bacterium]|nr:ABC-F family ATP-binding cassette domain-containing protein [Saprospiraceae bacterium]
MNYLTIDNISKTYGEKVLFSGLSLQINKGQKVAIVAKNGTGKTTLLRVIAGRENPEGENASVYVARDVRVGYLEQDPDFFEQGSVLDAVFDADTELTRTIKRYEALLHQPGSDAEMQSILSRMDDLKAWDFEARVREMLTRFNLGDFSQPVSTLSGGQRKRLALVHLILTEPEFLIIDEPTNHLDLDMIEWLEGYLAQPGLTLFMVTHDRYFLERVCNTIVELDNGQLYKYSGNYSDFLEKKAIREENENLALDKGRKLLSKELDWMRRMPQARTTKAKSRIDAFYNLHDKVSNTKDNSELQIDIKGQRLGKKILELHNVSKRFGDKSVLEPFNYKFQRNERIGIVGPNGVGKSSFLRLLTGELRPDTGKVVQGDNTVFGYYSQDGLHLPDDKRVIDVILDIAEYIPLEKGQKLTAAQLLERFLFNRKQQLVYVSQLSGGEKRRLYLLTVLMRNPNFLILDEPTNDLDVISLNVLEEFLLEFPGCILIVSHDRFFLDKLAQHLFIFEGEGRIKDFNGDYTEYREIQKEQEREQRRQDRSEQQKIKAAQKPVVVGGLSPEERKELQRLEKDILKLESRRKEIESRFSEQADLSAQQIQDLSQELATLNGAIEAKEMRWMELAERA